MNIRGANRRRWLQISGGLFLQAGLVAPIIFTTQKSSAQQTATPSCGRSTPPQMAGPFFTPQSPERSSLIEPSLKAKRMRLMGQVVDTRCQPVPGALLDFWQCDEKGEYDNQGFRLRGHQFADRKGQFVLDTVVPGAYPGRTPHLHVKVQRKGGQILTTQLYLPGHPGNAGDLLFDPRLLMVARGPDFFYQFVLAS
ncbi:MAG: intradiol ring-cleavage dioxygenase [Oxalobacteraceae bacterium]|jgi:protocatechuate 3,4-dioxygenase beta subunit|nr:intradiol ring-cleavage dioxygenase [Oxalobacteraceae bacterium]